MHVVDDDFVLGMLISRLLRLVEVDLGSKRIDVPSCRDSSIPSLVGGLVLLFFNGARLCGQYADHSTSTDDCMKIQGQREPRPVKQCQRLRLQHFDPPLDEVELV